MNEELVLADTPRPSPIWLMMFGRIELSVLSMMRTSMKVSEAVVANMPAAIRNAGFWNGTKIRKGERMRRKIVETMPMIWNAWRKSKTRRRMLLPPLSFAGRMRAE